jgi:hypothetical protein
MQVMVWYFVSDTQGYDHTFLLCLLAGTDAMLIWVPWTILWSFSLQSQQYINIACSLQWRVVLSCLWYVLELIVVFWQILHLLGKEGPKTVDPSKYIRYIYNRVILENATVRASAVSALAKFGVVVESLRVHPSSSILNMQIPYTNIVFVFLVFVAWNSLCCMIPLILHCCL